jgi:hypothetical protein
VSTRATPAATALVAAGVLLALYPAARPWGDVTVAGEQAAFASIAWPLAHLAAVAGFALVAVGLLGLRDALSGGPGGGAARGALVAWWTGTALVLPYYGAEAFALHTLGTRGGVDPTLVEAIRMGAIQVTVFGVGLAGFAVAGVLAAVAVLRSEVAPRWGGPCSPPGSRCTSRSSSPRRSSGSPTACWWRSDACCSPHRSPGRRVGTPGTRPAALCRSEDAERRPTRRQEPAAGG